MNIIVGLLLLTYVTSPYDGYTTYGYTWGSTSHDSTLWHIETIWNTTVQPYNGSAWVYNVGNVQTNKKYTIDVGTNFGSLVTPVYDLTQFEKPYLEFVEYEDTYSSEYYQTRTVYICVVQECGIVEQPNHKWIKLEQLPKDHSRQWYERGIDLTAYENYTHAKIAFYFLAASDGPNNNWGWALDDIYIESGHEEESYSQI